MQEVSKSRGENSIVLVVTASILKVCNRIFVSAQFQMLARRNLRYGSEYTVFNINIQLNLKILIFTVLQ